MKKPTLWSAFTTLQRRNIIIYSVGIMSYKFALEYFHGAFLTMANERFGDDRYAKIGILTGLNYAAQGLGSIVASPLVKRLPTRIVLSAAVVLFGVVSTVILIVDAATGGVLKNKTASNTTQYGRWDPNVMFPIFTLSGISYGMIELIRRTIPTDVVGGDPTRLKKMNALVHVLYETAGTVAALTSTLLIEKFGYNYSSLLSPVLFAISAITWWYLDIYGPSSGDKFLNVRVEYEGHKPSETASVEAANVQRGWISSLWIAVRSFGKAFYYGGWLCLTHRKFVWLVPSYTIALYSHRYLESGILHMFASTVLGRSSLAQIMIGGSNFGELLGAASVMLFSESFSTPLPWLRMDAIALNLVWIIPFFPVIRGSALSAWKLAPCMIPISYGWAGGDCSLAAYIQSTLCKLENDDEDVSVLGSVMAFLYVSYLIIYSVISALLGRWVDSQIKGLGESDVEGPARYALKMVGGVQFTVLSVVILASTFIPKRAFALNPSDSHAETPDKAHIDGSTESYTYPSTVPPPPDRYLKQSLYSELSYSGVY
ncbi:hypothetical protein CBS101457_005708 [Exobasidium rhododendri]|nr:hypothetical protein CBS101457_005708 [Exobasidium rhododendri]